MSAPVKGQPNSRLCTLPPELRNLIYSFVLLNPNPISVTDTSLTSAAEPSLLLVCTGIRSEARKMYYKLNTFRFAIYDFDPAVLVAFRRRFEDLSGNVVSFPNGMKNWGNLVRWLRMFYDDPGIGQPELVSGRSVEESGSVAARAFEIVRDLKVAKVEWEVVGKILGHYRDSTEPYVGWVMPETEGVKSDVGVGK